MSFRRPPASEPRCRHRGGTGPPACVIGALGSSVAAAGVLVFAAGITASSGDAVDLVITGRPRRADSRQLSGRPLGCCPDPQDVEAAKGEGMAANIRDVRLRRIGRDDVVASALGNNAAWLCSCGRKTPLIGSLMIARGEVSCPSCGQQYRVVADARPEVAGAMMTMRWCPTAESTWGELRRPGGPPGTRARSDEAALVCRRARCC